MDHIVCVRPVALAGKTAVVLASSAIFQVQLTRVVVDRDHGWNVVDDRLELSRPGSQRVVGTLAVVAGALVGAASIVDVDVRTAPSGQPARVIMKRRCGKEKPTISTVRTSQADFDLTLPTSGKKCLPVRSHTVDVVVMNRNDPSPAARLLR